MFDRPDDAPIAKSSVANSPAPGNPARTDLERLFEQYDSLLTEGRGLSDQASRELTALAAVYDIDTDRPHEAVWRDLRGVLTRQTGLEAASETLTTMPLTLLVVEDDPEAARDLTETLVEAGHNVVGPFHDGESAEAAAGLHALDGALLDINLSGATDGVTLAARLKDRWGVRVIFLSGDISTAARNADLAEALVSKPYGRKDVLEALGRLTG